jgi:hypothetical protein
VTNKVFRKGRELMFWNFDIFHFSGIFRPVFGSKMHFFEKWAKLAKMGGGNA